MAPLSIRIQDVWGTAESRFSDDIRLCQQVARYHTTQDWRGHPPHDAFTSRVGAAFEAKPQRMGHGRSMAVLTYAADTVTSISPLLDVGVLQSRRYQRRNCRRFWRVTRKMKMAKLMEMAPCLKPRPSRPTSSALRKLMMLCPLLRALPLVRCMHPFHTARAGQASRVRFSFTPFAIFISTLESCKAAARLSSSFCQSLVLFFPPL